MFSKYVWLRDVIKLQKTFVQDYQKLVRTRC